MSNPNKDEAHTLYKEKDPRAMKYWHERGYDQQAVRSISELMMYIDRLIDDDGSMKDLIADEIREVVFREKLEQSS